MGAATVGGVVVEARIENLLDLYSAVKGLLAPEQVHRLEVPDALVDTGSTYLAVPRRCIEQLGFDKPIVTQRARTTRGSVASDVYGPVRLTIQGCFCTVDVAEIDGDCPVLIGQVPLELLDFVVDPQGQRLIGNPAHGGEHMFDLY
jgi:predicted aspartyl protease